MFGNNKNFKQTEIGLIPNEWGIRKLSDLSDFQYGLGESAKSFGDYVYIRITDISNDGFLKKEGLMFIKKEKVGLNYFLGKGDVLVARTGASFGKTYLFNENFKATYGGFLIKYLFNKELLNNKFFFQFSRSSYYWDQANSLVGGGAQPQFNANTIGNLLVPCPPLNEQQKIAEILSSLDDKIELNRKINDSLEKIVSSLFKRWFVDFEFPDKDGKPYKSSGGKMIDSGMGGIPEGWGVGFFGDDLLTSFIKSGIDKFDSEKIYLDTASVNGSLITDFSTTITIKERPSRANMQPQISSVWFAKMKDSRKLLFFDDYSFEALNNYILSTGFAGFKVKKEALYYIWTFILSPEFDAEKNSLCQGTTMQAINNENISKIQYLISSEEVLSNFNNLIKHFYQEAEVLKFQNMRLSEIRDSLLPKLMSGKIRVNV